MSRRTGGWLVALFVGVALAALLSLIHLPYAILKPGPVTNTLGNGRWFDNYVCGVVPKNYLPKDTPPVNDCMPPKQGGR